MAISASALSLSPVGNKTSETTTTVSIVGTASSDVPVGTLCVLAIAADNAGATGGVSVTGVTDSQGNTYTKLNEQLQSAGGAANDGCSVSIYGSVLTTALVHLVDSFSVTYSPATLAKAFVGIKVTGSAATSYGNDNNPGAGTTYTSHASASLAIGDIYIGAVANESGTVPGADSDTTNGTWSQSSAASGGSGADATKMAVAINWKITTTAAGTQTLDGATGANTDWALAAVWYTIPAAQGPARPIRVICQAVNRAATY